jgi:hypothetical protein
MLDEMAIFTQDPNTGRFGAGLPDVVKVLTYIGQNRLELTGVLPQNVAENIDRLRASVICLPGNQTDQDLDAFRTGNFHLERDLADAPDAFLDKRDVHRVALLPEID